MKKTRLIDQSGFQLFLLIMPLLILVFIFSYLPLYGWSYAIFDYKPGRKLLDCDFVGLANFTKMFTDKYSFMDIVRVMKNTLGMSFLAILASPLPMIFAIFLSEVKFVRYRKFVQTLTTIPNFISWVSVYSVAYSIFSVNDGMINKILMNMGVIEDGINFLASSNHVWLNMLLWATWKSLGWSAIMYMASIAGIDQEQYEAAAVDGASRMQQIWRITIPNLMPTFFVLLLLSVGNLVNNGMEQYFVFQNAMNKDAIEVLDLYVYSQGMVGVNYSFSTAVSILKSGVSVTLLFIANNLSKWTRGESIF